MVYAAAWNSYSVKDYEEADSEKRAEELYNALISDVNQPKTKEELEDWIERKDVLIENPFLIMLSGRNTDYPTNLSDIQTGLTENIENQENGGPVSTEGRFQGIYTNWQSIPLEKFNTSINDYSTESEWLEDVGILYDFLYHNQIDIDSMSTYMLQQYINKIQTLLASEGFKRYERNHPNARQNLLDKYKEISVSETAMERLEGTEEWDFINDSLQASVADRPDVIYTSQPKKEPNENAGESLDDVIGDANSFVDNGKTLEGVNTNLQEFSNTIYNILLAIGVSVAVIVGAFIGVKLMASNIETKVEAKQLLIPYVVGCVVVFGGFGIWKLVVTILQGM